jgi:hypothetical protein
VKRCSGERHGQLAPFLLKRLGSSSGKKPPSFFVQRSVRKVKIDDGEEYRGWECKRFGQLQRESGIGGEQTRPMCKINLVGKNSGPFIQNQVATKFKTPNDMRWWSSE